MKTIIIKYLKPPVIALLSLIIAVIFNYSFPTKFIPKPFNYFGFIFIIIGLSIMFLSFGLFKKNKTPIMPGKQPTALVASGPYRFTRNPMYLGMTYILSGIAIYLGSFVAFISPVIFFLGMNFIYVPFEEQKMEKLFGREYLEFKKKVRRWI